MINFSTFTENAERAQQLRDKQRDAVDKFKASLQKGKEEHERRNAVDAQNNRRKRVRAKLDAAGVSDDEGDLDDID